MVGTTDTGLRDIFVHVGLLEVIELPVHVKTSLLYTKKLLVTTIVCDLFRQSCPISSVVEHQTFNLRVVGSTPHWAVNFFYQNNYTDEQKIDLDISFCDTDNKI